jgi:nucleoside-diphosphate-sugar epimerase
VEEARKPLYGIAKAAAEKLCLMYGKTKGPPATVVRFWWAYGDEIGGKHLREMLKIASGGTPLEVPAGSGGSFLHMADLAQGIERCLFNPAYGRTGIFHVYHLGRGGGMVRDDRIAPGIRCILRRWTAPRFPIWSCPISRPGILDTVRWKRPAAALKGAISSCWETMRIKA